MANSDKNILITPNVGAVAEPTIRFTGANNTPLTLRVLDSGTLSFEGTAGQLFSIADGLTGTIFSVNDISGIPSVEVLDTGLIRLAQYNGAVAIGSASALQSGGVNAELSVTAGAPTTPGIIIRAAASQTADLLQWQNSAGTALGRIQSNGTLSVSTIYGSAFSHPSTESNGTLYTTTTGMEIRSAVAANIPLTIQNTNASPSGDLTQWKNTAGTVIVSINAAGLLNGGSIAQIANMANAGFVRVGIAAGSSSQLIEGGDPSRGGSISVTHDGSGTNRLELNTRSLTTYTPRLTVRETGRIGIGTTGPTAILDVRTGSSTTPLIVVRGDSGQSANLQEWQNSSGTIISRILSGGQLEVRTDSVPQLSVQSAGGAKFFEVSGGGPIALIDTSPFGDRVLFRLKGHSSQTNNMTEWQNSAGTLIARIEPFGALSVTPSSTPNGYAAFIQTPSASSTAATLRAATSQTADIQQWQNSAGTVLASVNASGVVSIRSGGTSGTTLYPVATQQYLQSRTENLVTNGFASLRNNTNFSGLTYEATDTASGWGMFTYDGGDTNKNVDEFIPVDVNQRYVFSYYIKLFSQSVPSESVRHYGYVEPFDADGQTIIPWTVLKVTGSTYTTLAAPLNPGDTTITLTNATGWHNSTTSHARSIAFYPYTNSLGYTYPDYTYSRNYRTDLWDAGGISGNVITLRAPYSGTAYPAGTKVANVQSGGTFDYIAGDFSVTPTTWGRFSGGIGPTGDSYTLPAVGDIAVSGNNRTAPGGFRWGTAFARIGWLLSYNTPVGTAKSGISAVTFGLDTRYASSLVTRQETSTSTTDLHQFLNSAGSILSKVNSAGKFGIRSDIISTASLSVMPDAAGSIGMIVRAQSSQSANLQEWQNSSGGVNAWISSTGDIHTLNRVRVGTSDIAGMISVNSYNATTQGIVIRGAASQTANLQEWQESGGQIRSYVDSIGRIRVRSSNTSGSSLVVGPTATTQVPVIVQGLASQTANLQEWQNDSGTVLASISSSGGLSTQTPVTLRSSNSVNPETEIDTITYNMTSNVAEAVDSFLLADYPTVEYTIQITQSGKTRSSKMLVVSNGTLVDKTEYAILEVGGSVSGAAVTVDASGSSAVVYVQVTDAATVTTKVVIVKTATRA